MDKQSELRQWMEMADNDLTLAEFTSKNTWPIPYAIICFHCQQAVEKYLKRFLVMHDIEPPKVFEIRRDSIAAHHLNPLILRYLIFADVEIADGYAMRRVFIIITIMFFMMTGTFPVPVTPNVQEFFKIFKDFKFFL